MKNEKMKDPAHGHSLLSRRALIVFLPLLMILVAINVALLMSSARQAHLQVEQAILNSLRILINSSVIVEDNFEARLTDALQMFLAEYMAHDGRIEIIDLPALQKRMGGFVDLYAIDASGVVRHSTLEKDIGLDFRQWPKFYDNLTEIRQSGEPRIDEIGQEINTGLYRKYAYLPTPDKRWILELGVKSEIIAQHLAPFDPTFVTQRLVADFPHLNQLRIIDEQGWQLSLTQPTQVEPQVSERVKRVLATGESENVFSWNRVQAYVPLPSDESDIVGERGYVFRFKAAEFDYNLNQVIFGVGVNLLLVLVSIALVLRLSRWMKQSEQRLRAANKAAEVANLRLTELSATDGLTGIANRRHFDEIAAAEWARAARSGDPLALLLVDVDFFKLYNDNYGHPAGDEALKQVATVLREHARRPGDLAARYGGEEFVVIAADTTADAALMLAKNIQAGIEALAMTHEYSSYGVLTVSIGVSVAAAGSAASLDDLLEMADRGLYKAKHAGRNRVEMHKPAAEVLTAHHASP